MPRFQHAGGWVLCVCALWAWPDAGLAQGDQPDDNGGSVSMAPPSWRREARRVHLGPAGHDGALTEMKVVDSVLIEAPGAAWVRLSFADVLLHGDAGAECAKVRITGLEDGAQQEMNAEDMLRWGASSAYFNGGAVVVDLLAAGGGAQSRVMVASVDVGERPNPYGPRSICGPTDDRVLSQDAAVGRLMPIGCTAWLMQDLNGGLLTAGHCAPAAGSVVQFNVPLSGPDGSLRHPPPRDQYPVEMPGVRSEYQGIGRDWCVMGVFVSPETGLTARAMQGDAFALAASPAAGNGNPTRITGYGVVSGPVSLTWNQVQKTHTGVFVGVLNGSVQYTADTTGGNSGSPVQVGDSRTAIGIHTHAGCGLSGGANRGTPINYGPLQSALQQPVGIRASGAAAVSDGLYLGGDAANNIGLVDVQSGAYGARAAPAPMVQGLAHDARRGVLWAVTTTGELWRLDASTCEGEPVGVVQGVSAVIGGLAHDPRADVLYAITTADGAVHTINLETLEAQPLGVAVGPGASALEFDPSRRALWALRDGTLGTELVRVDLGISPRSGAGTSVGLLGSGATDCNGLAIGADGWLYTIDSPTRRLLRVSTQTAATAVVGVSNAVLGAAYGMSGRGEWCMADADGSGGVDDLDITSFLGGFEEGDPRADVNSDGGIDTLDLDAFFQAIEQGC